MHLHAVATLAQVTVALALVLPQSNGKISTTISTLEKRSCTPTGPGVCNFGLENILPAVSGETQSITIFNNDCEDIGGGYISDLPMTLDSQLPYAVVITALDATFQNPHIVFRYGSDSIDLNNGGCSCAGCDSGLAACTTCQCAFNC